MDISQLFEAFSVGAGVWLFVYGVNRVFLWFKSVMN